MSMMELLTQVCHLYERSLNDALEILMKDNQCPKVNIITAVL